ncbi:MAG: ChbG/HpnK family deacetylase [Bacteroidota bacterium]
MKENITIVVLLLFNFSSQIYCQPNSNQKILLIRCDDIGMAHSVNMAVKEVIDLGIPFSASVMFTCPWYAEAVNILKNNNHVSIGIHLTLNSEWKNYRWGPVLGKEAVPSLVDSNGYFFPSRKLFYENNPTLSDVENELRAQIKRAIDTGLKIDYVDYHMGTAVDKIEHREIVEKLAEEYDLAISRYFGEVDVKSLYNDPIEHKTDSLTRIFEEIKANQLNLLVYHVGMDTPELRSMIDMNSFGLKEMSKHRNAELNALCSPLFEYLIRNNNVQLLNYRDVIDSLNLKNMRRPNLTGY